MILLLDTGVLGLVTNPKATPTNEACCVWLRALLADGARVIVPEIADYELRRELIRAHKINGWQRLDALKNTIEYLPINTDAMLKAAALWAHARNVGTPTAPDTGLDGDVILAAQALTLETHGERLVIATTNVGHLALFVEASEWQDITSA